MDSIPPHPATDRPTPQPQYAAHDRRPQNSPRHHDTQTTSPTAPTLSLEGYIPQPTPPHDRNSSSNSRNIPNPNDPIPDNRLSDVDNSNTTAATATYLQPQTKNPRSRPSSDSDDEQQRSTTPSKPPHKLVRLDHVPEPSHSSSIKPQPLTPALPSNKPPGRSRFPVEDIALPQLTPTEAELARAQLTPASNAGTARTRMPYQTNSKTQPSPTPKISRPTSTHLSNPQSLPQPSMPA